MSISNIHKEHYIYAYIDNRQYINNQLNPNYDHIIYIGQTCDPVRLRWSKHNSKIEDPFFNWIKTYGDDCVKLKTLYTIPENNDVDNERLSKDIEKYYIYHYKALKEPLINKQQMNASCTEQNQSFNKNGVSIKCITTGKIFKSINEACATYNLDSKTLIQRTNNKLNIGIDNNFNPLFWEFVNTTGILNQPVVIIKQYYFVYMITDTYYSSLQPIYIGITKNPHKRILNHLNSSAGNWILALYRAKYPNHLLKISLLYKTEDLQQAQYKEADLIREYSKKYILFNKQYNYSYNTNLKDFIYYTFNINLLNIKESEIASWIFQERFNKICPEVIQQINQPILMDNIDFNNIPEFDTIENNDQFYVIQINYKDLPAAVVFKKFKKYDTIHLSNVINTIKYLKQELQQNSLDDFEMNILKIYDNKEEAEQYRNEIWYNLKNQGYKMYNKVDGVHNTNAKLGKFADESLFKKDHEYTQKLFSKHARGYKLKCLNTNTTFICLLDAAIAANISPSMIKSAIKRNCTAGVFQDGTRLKWQYIIK